MIPNVERNEGMSNMKLLLGVVEDMHRLADSIHSVAESIAGNMPESADVSPKKETVQEKKPDAPAVTIDQVRAVLAEKSSAGKTAEVKALLFKYDAGKLSGVKPQDYAALLEEAKNL